MQTWTEIMKELSRPFPDTEIEWRINQSGKKSNGEIWATILPYINARAVTSRLDEVVGAENWEDSYEEIEGKESSGILCSLSITWEGKTVTKTDGAGYTDVESIKGGISDALKRAAAKFGIGKYLYYLDGPFFALIGPNGKERGKLPTPKGGDKFMYDVPSIDPDKTTRKLEETFTRPAKGDIVKVQEAILAAATLDKMQGIITTAFNRSWGEDEIPILSKTLVDKFVARGAK